MTAQDHKRPPNQTSLWLPPEHCGYQGGNRIHWYVMDMGGDMALDDPDGRGRGEQDKTVGIIKDI